MKTETDIIASLDKACAFISSLQTALKQLRHTASNIEDGFFQLCLDQESLYMKKIPHVNAVATM